MAVRMEDPEDEAIVDVKMTMWQVIMLRRHVAEALKLMPVEGMSGREGEVLTDMYRQTWDTLNDTMPKDHRQTRPWEVTP